LQTGNNFNVTQAQLASGTESTRAATATNFRTSSTYGAYTTGSSSSGGGGGSSYSSKSRRKRTPAIIGGVIGGLAVLVLLLVGALKLMSRNNNKSKAAPQQAQALPPQNTGLLNTPNTSISPLSPQFTPNTAPNYFVSIKTLLIISGLLKNFLSLQDGSTPGTPQPYYGMQQQPFTPSVMTQYTGASNQYNMQPGQNFAPPMSTSPPPPMQPGQNFAPPMSMSPPPPMQNYAPPMSMAPQPNTMAYGNRSGAPEF